MGLLKQEAPFLESLIQEQLFRGEAPDGSKITPPYRPRTIAYKKRKNQPFDRVTLKDKGDYYRSIRAKVRGKDVVIDATDSKKFFLDRRYGDNIGLSKKSLERVRFVLKKLYRKDKL